jgi:hypothetical protein
MRGTPKDSGICSDDTVAPRHAIKPILYLPGFLRIPLPGDLDADANVQ